MKCRKKPSDSSFNMSLNWQYYTWSLIIYIAIMKLTIRNFDLADAKSDHLLF